MSSLHLITLESSVITMGARISLYEFDARDPRQTVSFWLVVHWDRIAERDVVREQFTNRADAVARFNEISKEFNPL